MLDRLQGRKGPGRQNEQVRPSGRVQKWYLEKGGGGDSEATEKRPIQKWTNQIIFISLALCSLSINLQLRGRSFSQKKIPYWLHLADMLVHPPHLLMP